jgi:hypothetical protein
VSGQADRFSMVDFGVKVWHDQPSTGQEKSPSCPPAETLFDVRLESLWLFQRIGIRAVRAFYADLPEAFALHIFFTPYSSSRNL